MHYTNKYAIPLIILIYAVNIIKKYNCDYSHYFLQGHIVNKYCYFPQFYLDYTEQNLK